MKIRVTTKHIRKGTPGNPCNCPIALAIKEKLHNSVEVGPYHMFRRTYKGGIAMAKAPSKVEAFVYLFDRRQKVKPFTFEVTFRRLEGQKW